MRTVNQSSTVVLGCFALFILTACKSNFYFGDKDRLSGDILSCINDSTVFFNSSEMKISLKKLSCKEVCPDIPVFDFGESLWPNTLNLNFKEKYWALLTNNKYHLKVSGTIEKILIRPISGKLKYKRSEQILILSFRKEWKHSYHIIFNDRDSLLVLSKLEK